MRNKNKSKNLKFQNEHFSDAKDNYLQAHREHEQTDAYIARDAVPETREAIDAVWLQHG